VNGVDLVVVDGDDFARQAAEAISSEVRRAVSGGGACSVGLAGGSTPREAYFLMGGGDLADRFPWDRVDFYFGDERCVPLDDEASNFRMARESLFRDRADQTERLHPMTCDGDDPQAAALAYEEILPRPLDLLLLGMGDDGHTASLFPGSRALREMARRVVAVEGPTEPRKRLTVTPRVLQGARRVLVLVAGRAKAEMLARAVSGPWRPEEMPVQLARHGTWIVDREAASGLREVS
jgi:6-phosphogluconolactonase